MLGRKEIWYFGFAAMAVMLGAALAVDRPGSLMGFAAVLTPICGGLYGGALGKLWVESRNGSGGGSVPSASGSK